MKTHGFFFIGERRREERRERRDGGVSLERRRAGRGRAARSGVARGVSRAYRGGRDVEAEVLHPGDGRPGPQRIPRRLLSRMGKRGAGFARGRGSARERGARRRDERRATSRIHRGRAGKGAREARARLAGRTSSSSSSAEEGRWGGAGADGRGGSRCLGSVARRGESTRARARRHARIRPRRRSRRARTVLRAVLGVFARRCSPPSSAARKGCGEERGEGVDASATGGGGGESSRKPTREGCRERGGGAPRPRA